MKKTVMAVILSCFSLIIFIGCSNEVYSKEAAETYFINAIVLAYDHNKLAETITSDTAYIVSEKIIEKQSYRKKVLENEKFFNQKFGNVRRYEQELNRGLICVAKFYFDVKKLNEMIKRVKIGVEKEKGSRYEYMKRKLVSYIYRFEKKLEKIKDIFN